MANAKAPAWLTTAFAAGVDERQPRVAPRPTYKGAYSRCALAPLDPRRRPCSGRFERFHWLRRQHVEDRMTEQLRGATLEDSEGFPLALADVERDTLVLLAAWDSRNADPGCEGHHRRYDSHLTPDLTVRYEDVPKRVIYFAFEWGIDGLLDCFPSEI